MTVDVPIDAGDRCVDRKTRDDEVLVLAVYEDATADTWYIPAIDGTVADANPEYDPEAAVVRVVYAADVEDHVDGWRCVDDLVDAADAGALRTYDFPVDRLAEVGAAAPEVPHA